MWNQATASLVADEKVIVLGVVQEQHAERAQLYKQWKQYKFPIVQDSFTELGLAVVPIPILIDENGFVIATRIRPSGIANLVATETEKRETAPGLEPNSANVEWLSKNNGSLEQSERDLELADCHLRTASIGSIKKAIKLYHSLLKESPDDPSDKTLNGLIEFRLGVANRMLYDLGSGKAPDLFLTASIHWSNALAINPNQYIWRRRIQQYGPRQIKPYPFYDWVEQAQKDIVARGETPVPLLVPLSGAEIAQRQNKMSAPANSIENPDPESKILLAAAERVHTHSVVVPDRVKPGQSVRVHLRFDLKNCKWNNESETMVVWVNENAKGIRSHSKLDVVGSREPESKETRTVEFEFQTDKDADSPIEISGYALAYLCKTDGQCVYRRIEFKVPVKTVD